MRCGEWGTSVALAATAAAGGSWGDLLGGQSIPLPRGLPGGQSSHIGDRSRTPHRVRRSRSGRDTCFRRRNIDWDRDTRLDGRDRAS